MAEIIHAAIIAGRRGYQRRSTLRQYSGFDMLYRALMVYANLKTSHSSHIEKNEAYRSPDPSEKSSVSYFAVPIFTELIGLSMFGIPWLLYLDVYPDLDLQTAHGGNPDLVGKDEAGNGGRIKGRSHASITESLISKAKNRTVQPRAYMVNLFTSGLLQLRPFHRMIFICPWKLLIERGIIPFLFAGMIPSASIIILLSIS